MDNQKTVEVNGENVTITKIPLGKYPKLIESFQGLVKHKDKFADLSSETIFQALPQILIVATPEVINLMVVVTDQPKEKVEAWGLDDFVKVIEALFALNNYQYVYQTLKKAMGSIKAKPLANAANPGITGTQNPSGE
jgi:hypothetical protein